MHLLYNICHCTNVTLAQYPWRLNTGYNGLRKWFLNKLSNYATVSRFLALAVSIVQKRRNSNRTDLKW